MAIWPPTLSLPPLRVSRFGISVVMAMIPVTIETSYSKLDTYAKCPKLFHYKYVRNLQAKRLNSHLFRGITAHDMLRDWYLLQRQFGQVTVTPTEFVARWITNYWTEQETLPVFEDVLFDQQKEVEQMGEYVRRYLELGLFDDFEILHVEEQFVITFENEDVVTFTPDLVVRDKSGVVWIVDHKTSGRKVDKDALDIRPQALLYYAGVRLFYPEVGGFIFNYIRKKVPTQPRLNKTGKKAVNNLTAIDTDYETLRAFCEANGLLDDDAHRRRLAELRDENTFFFQNTYYITDEMVTESLEDTEHRINLMRFSEWYNHYPRTIQPMNGCKRCDFRELCFTELTGGNTDIVLDWYEPREEKNPYEREEEDDG